MHLSSAAQWWDEWQLRILVLGSLGLQWFLVLAAPMRKYSIPLWLRRCIQLGSGCSDAVAIYALATVFNRHANGAVAGCYNGEADVRKPPSMLEVLWAPVLLIHLGGVEEVSASNIDDNLLWIRQTVTLLSQVTIALFGFYKSWPGPGSGSGDRRMLASAVLLFILGILSVLEKPLALRGARIDPLTAMSSVMKGARVKPSAWWKWCFTELSDRYKCWKKLPEGDAPILSPSDQVEMILSDLSLFAAEATLQAQSRGGGGGHEKKILEPLKLEKDETLKPMLRQAFGLIYTRANVMFTPAYLACHVLLVPSLHIAAIMLFATSQQKLQPQQGQGYKYNSGGTVDIKTTYVLLCFTALLDVLGVLISKLCDSLMFRGNVPVLCEKLAGYNLVGSVLQTTRTTTTIGWLLRCASRICYKEGYSREEKGSASLGPLVSDAITYQLVMVLKKGRNADLSSYRSFTKTDYWDMDQPERLLKTNYYSKKTESTPAVSTDDQDQHGLTIDNTAAVSTDDQDQPKKVANIVVSSATTEVDQERLMKTGGNTDISSATEDPLRKTKMPNVVIWRSLRKTPFDESVLIWHIATDLCFRSKPPWHFRCRPLHAEVLREVCTEAISNYMAYLLKFRPDMLMTGSRQLLFTETTKQMERIITQATKDMTEKEKQQKQPLSDEILLDKIKEKAANLKAKEAYTVIDEACNLAEELLNIEDENDRWHLMHRVWVGMLCYSASMCRAYLHAKSLGEGGEFLSKLWLLMSLQGAKTLADKLQMPEKEQGDDDLDDQKPEQEYQDKNVTMPGWDPEARILRRHPY
ncbi:unnamed protein product [Miscanthus lutarioriparius]|uniref:DUF4220 domain-containing protein n=1 Tax=Miscanthus lutarioriparius TaxID=422564 RepID=A0A811RFY6_9POAL|nr:unnamed protein product [Miscanthus lutarioriparius]